MSSTFMEVRKAEQDDRTGKLHLMMQENNRLQFEQQLHGVIEAAEASQAQAEIQRLQDTEAASAEKFRQSEMAQLLTLTNVQGAADAAAAEAAAAATARLDRSDEGKAKSEPDVLTQQSQIVQLTTLAETSRSALEDAREQIQKAEARNLHLSDELNEQSRLTDTATTSRIQENERADTVNDARRIDTDNYINISRTGKSQLSQYTGQGSKSSKI